MTMKLETAETAAGSRMCELLDSVRGVFAAKGFEKASMQDLAQAANMSAGNFYRYFPSKDAIIEAMVERDLAYVERDFETIMESDDPRGLLRAGLIEHLDIDDCDGGAIWTEILAAAKRRTEVASLFERMETMIVGYMVAVFGRIAGVDLETAKARYSAHATLIFMIIQGIKMRRRPNDNFHGSPLRALALRSIDNVLAEITEANPIPAEAGQSESA
ncbi:TetR/AcrR family transcriptional regulator [Frigidibacter sp. ROC022]|uniref:TetR/AcrR family transcriptional regulator n=1 Tax=Frigidibacter sp. ROC022 TaxID=2971796 RepID=UPI00215A6330|nr:TetR/AcrR family transcriptional regulator [Frigidibacter sp. ROC022]MCR8722856.1 TetR/AcrR family transcriptional regulator [Frigidibacter sp. ROC022]